MDKYLLQKYLLLSNKHECDVSEWKRLIQQIEDYVAKHKELQIEIQNYGDSYKVKRQMLSHLGGAMIGFQKKQHWLTRKRKRATQQPEKKSHTIRTLLEDIRLMERTENVPRHHVRNKGLAKTKSTNRMLQSLKREMGKLTTDEAYNKSTKLMRKYLTKIKGNELALQAINTKTLKAINDIKQLDNTIKVLKSNKLPQFKIKPAMPKAPWMSPSVEQDLKATIQMKKVKVGKKRIAIQQNELDVRPSYILKHIAELMPDMYHYLNKPKLI
ncbi:uncharacterized protein LOC115623922 [Scaptodrosophila lebanonensis]|uniref:Uncharacterized protein LOC115623922 n=1 Tax=Drosophila lebanonensis TaxID=7225 RepID=A0A6J2TEB6_DROLE|nr:uncharacterized protein LOC115623922 [Scaptodrosophila lebanonensis]